MHTKSYIFHWVKIHLILTFYRISKIPCYFLEIQYSKRAIYSTICGRDCYWHSKGNCHSKNFYEVFKKSWKTRGVLCRRGVCVSIFSKLPGVFWSPVNLVLICCPFSWTSLRVWLDEKYRLLYRKTLGDSTQLFLQPVESSKDVSNYIFRYYYPLLTLHELSNTTNKIPVSIVLLPKPCYTT